MILVFQEQNMQMLSYVSLQLNGPDVYNQEQSVLKSIKYKKEEQLAHLDESTIKNLVQ
ncbi:unnamed protein product [Paramecium octaurelia]|uniref:Uncharacterized protein n=1 Tax=Paramecium octaurelia TaxID=43137 RepID=A0A8S1XZK2_PAROT|nr:unnamed protein product [Paramecium octaurelia]